MFCIQCFAFSVLHSVFCIQGFARYFFKVDADVDDCLAWVQKAEVVFSSDLTSITDEDAMIEAFGKHEAIYREMDQRKDRIETVLRRGSSMLDVFPSADKGSMKGRLDVLFKKWSNLSERASSKESNFDNFVSDQEFFYENLEGFIEWMQRLGCMISEDIDEEAGKSVLNDCLLEHRDLCGDIKGHKNMYEKLIENGNKILEGLPVERKASFDEHLRRLKSGWENLVDVAIGKEQDLALLAGDEEHASALSKQDGVARDEQQEIESILSDLDVIADGLKKVRVDAARIPCQGTVSELMQNHLAMCLQSDAEIEKLDALVAKAAKLPQGNEDRIKIDCIVEKLQEEWQALVEGLHRERSDLEKAVEFERTVEELSDQLVAMDGKENDENGELGLVDQLDGSLEGLSILIDKNMSLQDQVLGLPESKYSQLKRDLLAKVEGLMKKAEVRKQEFKGKIDSIVKINSLKQEAEGILFEVASLNETELEKNANANKNEDKIKTLSGSIMARQSLLEKTIRLKLKIEDSREHGAVADYVSHFEDIESKLTAELEKDERKLVDLKTSKRLKDDVFEDFDALRIEAQLKELADNLPLSEDVLQLQSVEHKTEGIRKDLKELRRKTEEIRSCFEQSDDAELKGLLETISELDKRAALIAKTVKSGSNIVEKSSTLGMKFAALENDFLSFEDSHNLREQSILLGSVEKEILDDVKELRKVATEMQDDQLKMFPPLADFQMNLVTSKIKAAEKIESEICKVKAHLEERKRMESIEKALLSFKQIATDPMTTLENAREAAVKALNEIENLEIELDVISKSVFAEENGSENAAGHEVEIKRLLSFCQDNKRKISDKIQLVEEAIHRKFDLENFLDECESLADTSNAGGKFETKEHLLKRIGQIKVKGEASVKKLEQMEKDLSDIFRQLGKADENIAGKTTRVIEALQKKILFYATTEKLARDFIDLTNVIKRDLEYLHTPGLDESYKMEDAEVKAEDYKTKIEDVRIKIVALSELAKVIHEQLEGTEIDIQKELDELQRDVELKEDLAASFSLDLANAKENVYRNNLGCEEIFDCFKDANVAFERGLNNSKSHAALSQHISGFISDIDSLDAKVVCLSNDLANSSTQMPAYEKELQGEKISNLKTKLTAARSRVSNLQKDILILNDKITENESSMVYIEKWMDNVASILREENMKDVGKELGELEKVENDFDATAEKVQRICENVVKSSK